MSIGPVLTVAALAIGVAYFLPSLLSQLPRVITTEQAVVALLVVVALAASAGAGETEEAPPTRG